MIVLNFSNEKNNNNSNNSDKYFNMGVHTVKIATVDFFTPEGKPPYMEIKLTQGTKEFIPRVYITEKTLFRINDLIEACGGVKLVAENVTDIQIKAIILNKEIDVIIGGEEFVTPDGEIKIKKVLPFRGFCAKKGSGTLKFDESKHIKRLNVISNDKPTSGGW